MANQFLQTSVTCKLYEDLINKCNEKISRNALPTLVQGFTTNADKEDDVIEDNSTIDLNSDTLDKTKFQELSRRIGCSSDTDFLIALRVELQRQLDFHKRRTQQHGNFKVIKTGHPQTYIKSSHSACVTSYYHFDGDVIAREMNLRRGQSAELYIAGNDDSKMCHFNLHGMEISESMKVSEDEFNKLWSEQGGLPFVRPSRLARRHLFSALSKKV